jgi:hypothetical protein
MRANRILLIDHPKANAWKLAIQIIEHLGESRAISLNVVLVIRVGEQWAWNVNFHISTRFGGEGVGARGIAHRQLAIAN